MDEIREKLNLKILSLWESYRSYKKKVRQDLQVLPLSKAYQTIKEAAYFR